GSDAILFARDVAFDPGGTTMPRIAALHMLRSTVKTVSAPAISSFRGSIPHPTQRFGVTAASRNTRFQAPPYGLTWVGLAPTDRASFAAFAALRLMTNSYFTLHPATILIASAFQSFWAYRDRKPRCAMPCTMRPRALRGFRHLNPECGGRPRLLPLRSLLGSDTV